MGVRYFKLTYRLALLLALIILTHLFVSLSAKWSQESPSLPDLAGNDTVSIIIHQGWNLISLPVNVDDGRVSLLFPSASSKAYIYNRNYVREDTVSPGVGFWLKFPAAEMVMVSGAHFVRDTIPLKSGWNMIGTVALPIPTGRIVSVPSNIVISKYYRYDVDGGYKESDTLLPGNGYWVKASQAGNLREVCWAAQPLIFPPDANRSLNSPILMWKSSACPGNYRLQVSTDSLFSRTTIDTFLVDTSYSVRFICSDTQYFWRAGVSSGGTNVSWSSMRRFTWAYSDSGLVLPMDDAGTTETPYLIWSSASCASAYRLQLAADSLFQNLVVDSVLTDTVYHTTQLDSAKTYFWRVGVSSGSGETLWTVQRSFIVAWKYMGLARETIGAIAFDWSNPNIMYAGSYADFSGGHVGGIFKSTDAGVSWDTLVRGVAVSELDVHPRNANIIYATLGINGLTFPNTGIWKSTNYGSTWTRADSGIPITPTHGPRNLAIDPGYPETLYVGTGGIDGGSVYKSTNGGQYWVQLDADTITGLDNSIGFIVIDPLNTNVIYVTSSGDNYKTTDGGINWTKLNMPYPSSVDAVDPHEPDSLYAGSGHGIYISPDAGTTWHLSNNGLPVSKLLGSGGININPVFTDHLYITAHGSYQDFIFKSDDRGNSWKEIPSNYPVKYPFYYTLSALKINPAGTMLYAGVVVGGIHIYLLGDL